MTAHDFLGGYTGVRTLVDRFLTLVANHPDADHRDLSDSADELTALFIERLGGPPVYSTAHEIVSQLQAPVPLPTTTPNADLWIECMNQALAEQVRPGRTRDELSAYFCALFAPAMRR